MVPACRSTSFLLSVMLVLALGTTQMYGQPGCFAQPGKSDSSRSASQGNSARWNCDRAPVSLARPRDTWNPLTFPAESRSTLHALGGRART